MLLRGGSWVNTSDNASGAYRDRSLGFRVVLRGVSWSHRQVNGRAAFRYSNIPGSRYDAIGFRLVGVEDE